jgi:tetratricopeptide (TPR) repeat protein
MVGSRGTVSLIVLLLFLSLLGYAQGTPTTAPFAVEVTPSASVPLPGSDQQFSTGSLLQLVAAFRLPFFPLVFFDSELGYGSLPLKAGSSVTVLSGGAGVGVEVGLLPWLGVKARGSGGYAWDYLADTGISSGAGSPYLYGGLGFELYPSPEIGVGVEIGFRDYMGLYQGLEASVGARAQMGGAGWPESVQAAGGGGVQPLVLEVRPSASIPLSDSGQKFETGSGVQLAALMNLPFLPILSLKGELGYGDLPLKAGSSVSVLSAGGGLEAELGILPWLAVKAKASGGYYYGFLSDAGISSGGGSGYIYGGAGIDIAVTQDISAGFETGYRNYIGVYQGLEAALGADVHIGGKGWAQRVQPPTAAPQSLSFEVSPIATIPLADSGNKFQAGGLVTLSGRISLPFLPIVFLGGELGYGRLPLKASSSVSVLSAGAVAGVQLGLTPWMSVKARGAGGYYFGYLATSGISAGGGGPYVYGGTGLEFSVSPALAVGLEVGYRYYVGIYQGLETALTSRLALGVQPAPSGGQPVEKNNLPPRPAPLTGETLPQTAKPGIGLEMTKVDLKDVYPVFYKFYDDHSVGSAALHNWEKSPVQSVRVSVYVKEYMDNPKEVKGPDTVSPGADVSVELYALFKKDILANTEDTKVSATISLQYTLNGKPYTANLVQTLKVLKRNALTWDDDRKAAAYVSPNDPTAVRFAKNVAAAVHGQGNQSVEPNLRLAAAIHDALTLYGITYTSDPVATLNSDNKTVDYIQFPQQTLDYRSGKCSDFSALYASMFEAVGLETAFITIPGHIYMAVALTLSPDEARAAFTHRDDLIILDNKVWLPIEITLREGGFMKAWQLGAKEWRENLAKKQAALYPLHDAWKVYEPVGYSSSTTNIKLPADEKIVAAYNSDLDAFVKGEIGQQEAGLIAAVNKATTTAAKSKALNSLAVLHSRFGLYDQAIKELEQVLAKNEYVPSLINLGNIYFVQGDDEKALEFYNRAQVRDPKNPVVLLCVARTNHALENYSLAKKAYAALQVADPDLASKFAYLDLRGDEATRAADASGMKGVILWQDK